MIHTYISELQFLFTLDLLIEQALLKILTLIWLRRR